METQGNIPQPVGESSKQDGKAPKKYRWVEPAAWTPQMLEALERGVRGGKWFSLIDKVYGENNLKAAFRRVKANRGAAGVDHETVSHYEQRLDAHLKALGEKLKEEKYEPSAVRRVYIPKPGSRERRPLGIPTVADRTVQAGVRQVIEPIFEREFMDCSYGFRPRRGCKDALRRVSHDIRKDMRYVVDADIKGFFEHINHEILMKLLEVRIADGRVLKLIRQFLKQGTLEDGDLWTPEEGTPQGGVISPLLANIYLHEVDVDMMKQGYEIVRYADDLVILCQSRQEAEKALEFLRELVASLKLELHPEKTRIVDMTEPGARFTFLGYDFVVTKRDKHIRRYPSKKSTRNLRWRIRNLTHRTNGNSLSTIIERINRTLRGWFEYFKHSSAGAFDEPDGWIRARLRAILAKRLGHRGRGHGLSHYRWPNAYFHAQGLFSMEPARALILQSASR
jgi:RNA-directed DNA polymerase